MPIVLLNYFAILLKILINRQINSPSPTFEWLRILVFPVQRWLCQKPHRGLISANIRDLECVIKNVFYNGSANVLVGEAA
jgi:hypothetical protein